MMIRAYDEFILEYNMDNLGISLDYVVNILKEDPSEFLQLFQISGLAHEVGNGNPKYTTGITAGELVDEVYAHCGKSTRMPKEHRGYDYSPQYWCGWILAYYQWYTGLTFEKILSVVSYDTLLNLYGVLHEADVSKAVDVLNGIVRSQTFLARKRKQRGMTQASLAKASGVSLRAIQLYEQRVNDISKAQYNHLKSMASVLTCQIEELLET